VKEEASSDASILPLPLTESKSVPNILPEYASKRAFDVVGAVFLGLLFSSLILLIVTLIRIEGEPILFRHKRIGRNGQMFHCIKFRTMVRNAEEALRHLLNEHPELRDEWTENHKLRNDPRVSRVGRILRLTSLDELPQLWNVLRGEMSLVGPRPERPEFVSQLNTKIPLYRERHTIKPGITGWAQLCYPYGSNESDAAEKLQYDLFYVKNRTLLFYLAILVQTVEVILWGKGAR